MMIQKIVFCSSLVCLMACSAVRLQRLSKCEFTFKSLSEITFGGEKIQVESKQNAYNKILANGMRMFFSGEAMPLQFNINLQVTNPTAHLAAMDKMEWKVMVNSDEIVSGVYEGHFEVPASSSALLSVPVNIDMRKEMKEANNGNFQQFVLSFIQTNSLQGMTITVKPYVKMASGLVPVPASFDIKPQ